MDPLVRLPTPNPYLLHRDTDKSTQDDFADTPSFAVVDQEYNPLIDMSCA